MPILIPNPSFIIHESCYVGFTLHYIHVPHHIIHAQPKTDQPEINKHPNTALSRPAPRSGWGVSLRRVPPPPRRGHKTGTGTMRDLA